MKEGPNEHFLKAGIYDFRIVFNVTNGKLDGPFLVETQRRQSFIEAHFTDGKLHGTAKYRALLTNVWQFIEEYDTGALTSSKVYFTSSRKLANHFEFDSRDQVNGRINQVIEKYFTHGFFEMAMICEVDTDKGTKIQLE